eukprot:1138687-Pelagomonas_calceolata.AAC.7
MWSMRCLLTGGVGVSSGTEGGCSGVLTTPDHPFRTRRSRSTAVDVNAVVEAPMSYEPNMRSRTSTILVLTALHIDCTCACPDSNYWFQQCHCTLSPPLLYACCTRAAIILGGGAGSRLFPLTKSRAKPAVPIGGTYRLIDVPMSNCINSGISKIYVLTQFNSTSLNRHLGRAYNMGSGGRHG